MNVKQFLKATLFGFLIWLIPLLISFVFYNQERQLVIDQTFFKSIMVITLSTVVILLCSSYFKRLKDMYLRQGLFVGVWWLAINLTLDAVILLPWLKIGFADYFMQTGIRYLTMPITTLGISYLLSKRG